MLADEQAEKKKRERKCELCIQAQRTSLPFISHHRGNELLPASPSLSLSPGSSLLSPERSNQRESAVDARLERKRGSGSVTHAELSEALGRNKRPNLLCCLTSFPSPSLTPSSPSSSSSSSLVTDVFVCVCVHLAGLGRTQLLEDTPSD